MNLFISHSSKDAKAAGEICEMLEKAGYKCFLAPRDIRSGYEYAEEIINGIDSSAAMVLLLSKAADSSPHVLREVERAVSKKLPIIVYKLEDITLSKSMEYFLMTHQWVSEKPNVGYDKLLDCVNGFFSGIGITAQAQTQVQLAENKKKGNKALLIKAVSISAAAAVLVTAAVLIFGVVNKPASALNDGIDITVGTTLEGSESVTTDDASATDIEEAAETSASTERTDFDVDLDTAETEITESIEPAESTASIMEDDRDSVTTSDNESSQVPPKSEETEAIADAKEEKAQSVPAATAEAAPAVIEAELGDTVVLGEYLNEPVKWRIIGLEDGGRTALVIADNVLTMKCFDAAEGGKYNSYDGVDYWRTAPENMDKETERLVRGDNTWETSNLRAWLNSDRDNVIYSGQEPNSKAMSEKKNGYNTEGGFLKSFSKEEIKAILTSTVTTNGITTEDKVFLLSVDELSLLDEADVNTYAVPTDSAAEQDQAAWYALNVNEYKVRDHYWWLRDPNTDTASEVYIVNNSYAGDKVFSHCAGLEGYGVRPVMRIDLTAECVEVK